MNKTPNNLTTVLYFGRNAALPAQIKLHAGPLSLVFEAGDLRYIALDEYEILRRVYVAVRDQWWGTAPAILSNLQVTKSNSSFHITFDIDNKQADLDFFWRGQISGDAQGTINFRMDGEARSTFLRSRIGFCVLHPTRCRGVNCQISHVTGNRENALFPLLIAPQLVADGQINPVYPFADIRALQYEVKPGVQAEIRFEGEVFEMEDQRNWTDASFKTYCTPLNLPFPVEVLKGTRVSQSITVTLKHGAGELASAGQKPVQGPISVVLQVASDPQLLPRLGLGVASHGQLLSTIEVARMRALNLSHLRVELLLGGQHYEAALLQAWKEAEAIGIGLEVALVVTDAATVELAALRVAVDRIQPLVKSWLVFHERDEVTTRALVMIARNNLSSYDPRAKIGGGTNAYFTQINRNPLPLDALDLVSYSLNPQVHAFDNASLVETLEVQAATVKSARKMIGKALLQISPITLLPRLTVGGSGPAPAANPGQLPPQVDVRQMSLFGAGWTVGSIKYLAESGVENVTYYETSGWRGVMETELGSPLPDLFLSQPGSVFPVYHIFADIGEFAGGDVIPTVSSATLQVESFALHKGGKTRVLISNLTAVSQHVIVHNIEGQVRVRQLDEINAIEALCSAEEFRNNAGEGQLDTNPLKLVLRPFATVRVDSIPFGEEWGSFVQKT